MRILKIVLLYLSITYSKAVEGKLAGVVCRVENNSGDFVKRRGELGGAGVGRWFGE